MPSAIASTAMLAGIAAMVVYGLAAAPDASRMSDPLAVVSVAFREPPPPTEPPPPPKRQERSAPRDAASPRNLRNQATLVTAPIVPPLILPPPVIAAPKPGIGNASNNGASDRIGTGQGAGGVGDGLGGGGDGGDGEGDYSAPRQIGGDLRMSDLPGTLLPEGGMAQLEARYTVYATGRVGQCRIIASSGIAQLDTVACRSIEQRFRYKPSRDGAGQPVDAIVERRFSWRIDGAIERSGRRSGGD